MAFKQFEVAGIGPVVVYKRRGSRSLRLSVTATGKVRVTIPAWTAYQAGVQFARLKAAWIAAHRPAAPQLLIHNQPIGKSHHLQFIPKTGALKVTTRLQQQAIAISYPSIQMPTDAAVQTAARRAAIRALKRQAEQLLPIRLEELAQKYGFSYRKVTIKQMTSRWGSCDSQRNIALNLYLMQLPWPLIDYVLLHELTHTQVLRHGPPFWQAMDKLSPNITALRRQLRSYQPVLGSVSPVAKRATKT